MVRQTVEKTYCDICGDESSVSKCSICNRDMCILCEKSTCFVNLYCKQCISRDDVSAVKDLFREDFNKFAKKEHNEIMKLPKFKPKICEECGKVVKTLYRKQIRNNIKNICGTCRHKINTGDFDG